MVSRRNFLRGIAAAPVVLALDHEALTLQFGEAEIAQKMKSAVSRSRLSSGIVASGGLCAPISPLYDSHTVTSRPIRDNLPTLHRRT